MSKEDRQKNGKAPAGAFGEQAASHYRAFAPVPLAERAWPDRVIDSPPVWCSVDLRDGNQALIDPMGPEAKHRFFEVLVATGFKQIEVGFPAAAETEYEFVRSLIENDRIPEDVTVQVLTQARDDLIEPTFDALRGARRAIVHLYNSTSELQRRVVFGKDRAGIVEIARRGAARVRELASQNPDTEIVFQYSPESFTGTELDFAIEICEVVADIWEPTEADPMIVNLPATVEMSTPNIYADQVEYFARSIRGREKMVLSVHPHNDRGTGVAAAELGMMAGADRVEGTLFGNGERTGNVDIVTLALNLFTQGVDPGLDFSDINAIARTAESCTGLPIHPRHPYVGELVFTAFSGSHQDAIRKGLAALSEQGGPVWEVPYLPINPAHVGRGYDPLIRVNSQSGKGGVAFLLEEAEGFYLPRRMQIEFQRCIQAVAEDSGAEVEASEIVRLFKEEYLSGEGRIPLSGVQCRFQEEADGHCRVSGHVEVDGACTELDASGNGPIDAAFSGLQKALGFSLRVSDYAEHALGRGSEARAVAYVEVSDPTGASYFGAGCHESTLRAALEAVLSAVNRAWRLSGSPSD